MTKDIVIAIDEGTTNCKAVAIDGEGKILGKASRALEIDTPNPGWVEQDGKVLVERTIEVVAEVIGQLDPNRVGAIGISNQRETGIGWYRDSGEPLNAAITWQCSRTADFCASLREQGKAQRIKEVTGLPVATLFAGSKFRWLLDNTKDGQQLAAAGKICLGTIDSWLLWNLTGQKVFGCDYSNAARTQLLNLKEARWDQEMLSFYGIPAAALPEIHPSSFNFGSTLGLRGIPDGIPVMSMIGDSHAALYGHCLGRPGFVKATYGTGSSVMAPLFTADTSVGPLATTVAWHDGQRITYGLEGNIAHTGDALNFMATVTGVFERKDANEYINGIFNSTSDNMGVYFVPMLTGAGAPWWNEKARGTVVGLTRGTTTAHLIRASLESIAYQIADVIEFMKKAEGFKLATLMTDGGPTKNSALMQFQADLLGCPVSRSDTPELSAIGAGLLAMKCKDHLADSELERLIPQHETFTPDLKRHEELLLCKKQWDHAVSMTLEF
ncbi:MAG: glycerol kinase [Succinivibrio sp.]|nr:glycerol kinase [Succinivibrio sp.]